MNFSPLELRIPPVIVVAVSGWLMWALRFLFPQFGLALPGRTAVALLLVIAGMAAAIAGVAALPTWPT